MRYKKKEDPVLAAATGSSRQVNVCARTYHGVLQISGSEMPYLIRSLNVVSSSKVVMSL